MVTSAGHRLFPARGKAIDMGLPETSEPATMGRLAG
jgi:hypothetical protein